MRSQTLPCYVRYADLVEAGIVRNRTTLLRWIRSGRFPKPTKLGPNVTAWKKQAILEYLDSLEGK